LLASEGRTAETDAANNPLAVKPPHFPSKAKNVIFLFMGRRAESARSSSIPKPELQNGTENRCLSSMTKDLKLAFIKRLQPSMASPRHSNRTANAHGDFRLSADTATCADDICLVRSAYSEAFNHHPGQSMLNAGVRSSAAYGRLLARLWSWAANPRTCRDS